MSEWTNIEEIIQEFSPDTPKDDLISLRDELKRQRNELHPDKTHIPLDESPEKAKQYYRLDSAIKFLDEQTNTGKELALIPVSQLPAIVEAISKAIAIQQQPVFQITQVESTIRTTYSRQISNRVIFPKIGSTALAGVSLYIYGFWGAIKDTPFFGVLTEAPQARLIWLYALILSVGAFILTLWYEHATQARVEFLLSEDGVVWALRSLIRVNRHASEFSKRMLIAVLQNRYRPYFPSPAVELYYRIVDALNIFNTVPLKIASECADVILAKLKERGAVQKSNRVDIEELYRISKSVFFAQSGMSKHKPLPTLHATDLASSPLRPNR